MLRRDDFVQLQTNFVLQSVPRCSRMPGASSNDQSQRSILGKSFYIFYVNMQIIIAFSKRHLKATMSE